MIAGDWLEIAMTILTLVTTVIALVSFRERTSKTRVALEQFEHQRRNEREAQRIEHLRDQLDRLIELRSRLQLVGWVGGDISQRELAYGEAYAIVRTLPNGRLRAKATLIMECSYYPVKNAAVDEAIVWLSKYCRSFDTTR